MRASRERSETGTENAGSCSGPNGEANAIADLIKVRANETYKRGREALEEHRASSEQKDVR